MLSAGLRLLLAVAAPLAAAALVHELRVHRRTCVAIALVATAACAGLTLTMAQGVSGGGSLERAFGSPLPGVALTARADAPSVAVLLIACLATFLAIPRHRGDGERLAGMLLCLTGVGLVAAAGNLVLVAGGVEVLAAGTLLLRGRRGPGRRSTAVVAGLVGGAGLALLAAAAELVAAAGSSDLALLPAAAVGGVVAVPWALAGAALLVSPAIPGEGGWPDRDWAAIGTVPAGFLVLLRLQVSTGSQLPGGAVVALATAGALLAISAAALSWGSPGLPAAGRGGVAVLAGVLVSLFGGSFGDAGALLAGLLLVIEVALVASPSWTRRPTAWSAASVALLALPGGAAFALVAVGLGTVARHGSGAFPQLLALTSAVAVAAIVAARAAVALPWRRRPVLPGAALAVTVGVAGGLIPGTLVRTVATPLAVGATAADLDAGSLALAGGGFAGGYFAAAAAVLVVAGAAAMVVAGDTPVTAEPPRGEARLTRLRLLLRVRRGADAPMRRAGAVLGRFDHWLEGQPGVAFLVGAAVLGLVLIR